MRSALRHLSRPFEFLARYFFGTDVFISYGRADAFDYAGALAARLAGRGISVFLDQIGTDPGEDVPPSVLRGARRAAVLVVLGSPAALASRAVAQEVNAFRKGRPLVPLSFGPAAARWPEWGKRVWGLPVGQEEEGALRRGEPSDGVVERVALSVGRWRQQRRISVAAMSAVAVVIGAATVLVVLQNRLANTVAEARTANTRLDTASEELQKREKALVQAAADLTALQGLIGRRESELRFVSGNLRKEQQVREEQVQVTTDVWDFLQQGIQKLYASPDLSCAAGTMRMEPALSIYFYSDYTNITNEAKPLLDQFAACYLKMRTPPRITIEGHVSERRRNDTLEGGVTAVVGGGTAEYSLALGERHATAVATYLIARGIPGQSIETVSYGEDFQEPFPLPIMNNRARIAFATR